LEQLCESLKLAKSVRFLDQRKDVEQLLLDSSIFAFTSLTEGFPNALAEAMAAGCACISYDCPTGPSELIEHGVNGFLVAPGDEAEYARLLQQLMNDADLRATFSRKARKCMEQFEAGLVMQRLKGMIEESIGGQSLRNS
jgi:GalNAc-alpha-(1->4)-GalNAc-alpha-(1->3)-diNAcBac-PP-undecaprenol alpha-1,4-N-acetyl-D-galactosaminyltransferase